MSRNQVEMFIWLAALAGRVAVNSTLAHVKSVLLPLAVIAAACLGKGGACWAAARLSIWPTSTG